MRQNWIPRIIGHLRPRLARRKSRECLNVRRTGAFRSARDPNNSGSSNMEGAREICRSFCTSSRWWKSEPTVLGDQRIWSFQNDGNDDRCLAYIRDCLSDWDQAEYTFSHIFCKIFESRRYFSRNLVEIYETGANIYCFPLNFSMTFYICVSPYYKSL